jgi:hypothetical protein
MCPAELSRPLYVLTVTDGSTAAYSGAANNLMAADFIAFMKMVCGWL